MTALIVDDSSAMRSFLRRILAEHGLSSVQVANGKEALEFLSTQDSVDLVLLDWNMPIKNGLETLLGIRARTEFASVPAMMVTTEIDQEEVATALDAEANEYLMKPFTPELVAMKLSLLGFEVAAQ